MQFFQRAAGRAGRLGVLPGTFNPPTVAHLALARAALRAVDEVLFVLPRALPHKEFSGASFADRAAMLTAAVAGEHRFSAAAADGGLFLEIADECRPQYPAGARLTFLCGRDAAERIMGWNYGREGVLSGMLADFNLLVAARGGEYLPPEEFRGAVDALPLEPRFEDVSATDIRRRIACGEPWEHLVPAPVRAQALRIYGAPAANRLTGRSG
jgi:nicotinate-nucleotide adenylyltransferase